MSSSTGTLAGVLDASAILAILFDEPGSAIAQRYLQAGTVSAVNLAEVAAKLADRSITMSMARTIINQLNLDVRAMTADQAWRSASLRDLTRSAGLSLGDRACLALAAELDYRPSPRTGPGPTSPPASAWSST